MWTTVNPPEGIVDWIHNDPANPVYIWPDHMGMHDNPSRGRITWPPPFTFGASRAIDRDGDVQEIDTTWARSNPAEDAYVWTGIDNWIDDNPGKTLLYNAFMTPRWAAKFPDALGGYSNWPGSMSPPLPGKLGKFLVALFAHLNATGRGGRIKYLEVLNEPRTWENDSSLDSRSPLTDVGYTKFLKATANEMADMNIEAYDSIPSDVLLCLGAWEGKSNWATSPNQTFPKIAKALGNKGKKHIIRAGTFHTYVYIGPNAWNATIGETRRYIAGYAGQGFNAVETIFDSELGAEYYATNPKRGMRFSDYTDQQQADSIERRVMSQRGLKVRHSMLYTYRDSEWDSNEFPPWKVITNERITTMHGYGGGWIYRMGLTASNKLWYSILTASNTQVTRHV